MKKFAYLLLLAALCVQSPPLFAQEKSQDKPKSEEKAKPYPASPSGATGVQTLVPLMLNEVNRGRCTIEQVVHRTADEPIWISARDPRSVQSRSPRVSGRLSWASVHSSSAPR